MSRNRWTSATRMAVRRKRTSPLLRSAHPRSEDRAYRCRRSFRAKAEARDIIHGLQAGGDDYLTKPFEHAALVACIRSLLPHQGRTARKYARRINQDRAVGARLTIDEQ